MGEVDSSATPEAPAGKTLGANQYAPGEFRTNRGSIHQRGWRLRMSEAFDIYTLLFLVLAVVIFIRLRNVLGRRTGNERPPFDPYTAPDQKRPGAPKTNEPVVALPRGRTAPLPEASGPSVEDIEARLGSHAPKDSPLARSLTQLMRADPSFDPGQFLDGAKAAYEMIVMSFAEGDEASLSQLLSAEVFEGFESAIRERESRGEKVESNLVGINKADIIESDVKKNTAYVTVKFVSELISVTRDAEGEVVEGDPKKVREVTDIWTFARDISSKNPNWKLVATNRRTEPYPGAASFYGAIAGALLLGAIAVTIALYFLLREMRVEEPGISFAPVSFADIEGWDADDQAAAFQTLLRSCGRIKRDSASTEACAAAKALAAKGDGIARGGAFLLRGELHAASRRRRVEARPRHRLLRA